MAIRIAITVPVEDDRVEFRYDIEDGEIEGLCLDPVAEHRIVTALRARLVSRGYVIPERCTLVVQGLSRPFIDDAGASVTIADTTMPACCGEAIGHLVPEPLCEILGRPRRDDSTCVSPEPSAVAATC